MNTGGVDVILPFSKIDAIEKFKQQDPQYSIKKLKENKLRINYFSHNKTTPAHTRVWTGVVLSFDYKCNSLYLG